MKYNIAKRVMESHRIHGKNNHDLLYQSKSYMTEFSPNPDDRKKKETSFPEFTKRRKMKSNQSELRRVRINQLRNKFGDDTFENQDTFNEIIEYCDDLERNLLDNFLTVYNLNLSIDDNLEKLLYGNNHTGEKNDFFIKNVSLYVSIEQIQEVLKEDTQHLLIILKNYHQDIPAKLKQISKKPDYLISYFLILKIAKETKIKSPSKSINEKFMILINHFKSIEINIKYIDTERRKCEQMYFILS